MHALAHLGRVETAVGGRRVGRPASSSFASEKDLTAQLGRGTPLAEQASRALLQPPRPLHIPRLAPARYLSVANRSATRTRFNGPYLAHFCSFFRHFFAVLSVLTPGFQKVAPNDRGRLRNGPKWPRQEGSPPFFRGVGRTASCCRRRVHPRGTPRPQPPAQQPYYIYYHNVYHH